MQHSKLLLAWNQYRNYPLHRQYFSPCDCVSVRKGDWQIYSDRWTDDGKWDLVLSHGTLSDQTQTANFRCLSPRIHRPFPIRWLPSRRRGNRTGRQMFPFAVTKSLENCLHISKNLTNFVYKLHIILYITYELDILSYLAAVIYTTFLSALF